MNAGWKIAVVAAALFAIAQPMLADDKVALTARLHDAEVDTSIDIEGLTPWHLKIDVELFDTKGAVTEQGTIEEWWAGPTQHLVVYSLPTYKAKVLVNGGAIFRTIGIGSVPSMLTTLLDQAVHPMPSDSDVRESAPELQKENFGKVSLDCVMLSQPFKSLKVFPMGLFSTYCFDPGKDTLRASYDFGSQTILRNAIGIFQKRSVAVNVTVDSRHTKVASGHISALNTMTIDPAQFVKTDELEAAGISARLSGGVMAGAILTKTQPIYPESARMAHISGAVVMRAIIGRDGHILRLQLKSAPDSDLAISALAAVRQWTYKPYTINGEPVEVDTTITVNYNLGI